MNAFSFRLASFIVVSVLVAILLSSALNNYTRVADDALAGVTASEGSNLQTADVPNAPTKNYLPIIFLNAPTDSFWILTGNSGTLYGTNFLGTTDNVSLTVRVNNVVGWRLAPSGSNPPNIIGGYSGNYVNSGVYGAVIGGGGASADLNRVTDNFGTIAGGRDNQAGDNAGTASDMTFATVGGGTANVASNDYATIAGGYQNTASGAYSFIGGGWGNATSGGLNCPGIFCFGNQTIGGGVGNSASGVFATIGGGSVNQASGDYSTISGGGTSDSGNSATGNRVTDDYGTVGGGGNNQAGDGVTSRTNATYATIGGGLNNLANAQYATVSGGYTNTASSLYAIVGGGTANVADAQYATIGGGNNNDVFDHYGTVAGGSNNTAGSNDGDPLDAEYATVAGGSNNHATDGSAVVGGGAGNTASGQYATVAGGSSNTASGWYSFIGGGGGTNENTVTDDYGTVAGGEDNRAGDGTASRTNKKYASVGGGYSNTASGSYSTIAGGYNNTASGDYSFAAGQNANAAHANSFVWNDGSGAFSSAAANEFRAQATNGFYFYFNNNGDHCDLTNPLANWQCYMPSDRAIKENMAPVDTRAIAAHLAAIPISTWNYSAQAGGVRHIGPMAQDFYATFNVGDRPTEINGVDANGVALAAIQGLYQMVTEKDGEIKELKEINASLDARVAALEASVHASTDPTLNVNGWLLVVSLASIAGAAFAVGRRAGARG